MPPKVTPAVREALAMLELGELPRNRFNPGVNRSLEKLGLVDTVARPSPYASSRGRQIEHQAINASGRAALAAARAAHDTR